MSKMITESLNDLISKINQECRMILFDNDRRDNERVYGFAHVNDRERVLYACKSITHAGPIMNYNFMPIFSPEHEEGKIIFSLSKINKTYSIEIL